MFTKDEAIEQILSDKIVSLEFADFFLGEMLGYGCSRRVFENPFDKTTVIKIDVSNWNANVMEHQVWTRVSEVKSINKWFAPVTLMSKCGRILLMKKCKPLIYPYPAKLPEFLTDIKYDNFGMYNGHVVCYDYAGNLLMEKGMSLKMRKVKWR